MSNASAPAFVLATDPDADIVTITILPEVYDRPELLAKAGYDWMRDLKGRIRVDFARMRHINSTLVAWLFQLVQWGPSQVEVINASERVRRQLKQFHLHHFVDFPLEDIDSSAILPGTR